MIDYKKAMEIFRKKNPKRIITTVLDYDKDWWVIEAPESLSQVDYNAPYFGVNKHDGHIANYSPSGDFDTFFDAMNNRQVYKKN